MNTSRSRQEGSRRWSPRARALRLLALRPQSVGELREKLVRGGAGTEEAEALIAELQEKKFLDDAAFTRSFVESTLAQKPAGRRWLSAKLLQHKIPSFLIQEMLATLLPPERERALADQMAERTLRTLNRQRVPDDRLQKRLFARLVARGFSTSDAWSAVEKHLSRGRARAVE